jgi:hypothetical protein
VAAALAAAIVVALLVVLTSVVLANNDAQQLDRRLDSIVDASMLEQLQDPTRRAMTTGRSRSTGQVVFQRGFQLPSLPPGSSTVTVNGVDYRVRTIPLEQSGGILVSIGIRADSILLSRARIPLYLLIGCAGRAGRRRPGLAAGRSGGTTGRCRLTEQTRRLGKDTDQIEAVHGAREAEDLSDAMAQMLRRLADARRTRRRIRCRPPRTSRRMRPTNCAPANGDAGRSGHPAPHDLSPQEFDEVVQDLARAQRRIEATITALGQLASGQLARIEDREPIDVPEMLDRSPGERPARQRGRDHGGGRRCGHGVGLACGCGWPSTTWCATPSLGAATRVLLTAARQGDP